MSIWAHVEICNNNYCAHKAKLNEKILEIKNKNILDFPLSPGFLANKKSYSSAPRQQYFYYFTGIKHNVSD